MRPVLFAGLLSMLVFSNHEVRSFYALPFPPLQELVSGPHSLEDVGMIVGGFRSVAADVAWIQLLQNVSGSGPLGEDTQKPLPSLKEDTLRVVRIDPYFHRAYLFGAGILAWFKSVNRPEEALEVLQEGIRNNPGYWVFRSYVGAIVYQKKEDFGKVAGLLETAIGQPDCPSLVKAILANIEKSRGQYQKSLEIWNGVLDDSDNADYHARARSQIRELEGLIAHSKPGVLQ